MGTSILQVVGTTILQKFARKHATARKPLQRFMEIAQAAEWKHFPDVKIGFPATDYVAGRLIFDIGGNKYRIVASIDFEAQILWIESVMTHGQYGRESL